MPSFSDRLIQQLDTALRTLNHVGSAQQTLPTVAHEDTNAAPLSQSDQQLSAALMRVNHVGEVCAQALYAGQLFTARSPEVLAFNRHSAEQEKDHLFWTHDRIQSLGGRVSVLNPLWYAGSWALGCVAGAMGDRVSLAFVKETEKQVEAHLSSHLERLPVNDVQSRAIVSQMAQDEAQHAQEANRLGGTTLPWFAKKAMNLSAKVMTRVAHYV